MIVWGHSEMTSAVEGRGDVTIPADALPTGKGILLPTTSSTLTTYFDRNMVLGVSRVQDPDRPSVALHLSGQASIQYIQMISGPS